MAPRLVLIHGFTQNAACWAGIAGPLAAADTTREVLAVDAPGHGTRTAVAAGLWEAARLIVAEGGEADYLGYSMGGRIALHVALAFPHLVRRLVLLSATPGIEDVAERAARRAADEAQAAELQRTGDVGAFLERWLAGPMFAGLPRERAGLEARLTNTAAGLAASLRLCGTGGQDDLWPRLAELSMPVLVVAGGADQKYAAIAARMSAALPAGRLAIMAGAGHAAHLEQPEHFVALVDEFLREGREPVTRSPARR